MDNEFKNAELKSPHSNDAEKKVISCLIQNNSLFDEVNTSINYEMFYNPVYKAVFRSIIELNEKGYGFDTTTVSNETLPKSAGSTVFKRIDGIRKRVVDQEKFDPEVLNDAFFADILRAAPTTVNVKDYCGIVKEKFILRKTIELGERLIVDCRTGQKPTIDILNQAQNELFNYSKTSSKADYVKLEALIPEIWKKVNAASKIPDGITGLKTGFKSIDNLTAGLQKSDMIVVGARPAMGKTSFALNLAYNIGHDAKKNVYFFSLEMSAEQLGRRILSMESKIPSQTLRSGRLSEHDWEDFYAGSKRVYGTKIYIDADMNLTIADLKNKCHKLASDLRAKGEELDCVMIDYLQLMHAGTVGTFLGANSNRAEEVAEISRSIKALAKDLDIPIIALCQLNRESEKNKGKEPQLSDIRESGSIEQDADIVVLIHRPDPDDQLKTSIKFAKHRNGSTDTINLRFDKSTTKFSEYDLHN